MAKKGKGNKKTNKKAQKEDILDTIVKPNNKISKENYLQLRNNHLEMDLLKSQLSNIGITKEKLEREVTLMILKKDDIRQKMQNMGKQHERFLDEVKIKTGVDIRNKTIDPETLEVN